MKKIEIEIPDGKRAEWVDGVLTLVDEKPKDVKERIETFEDAIMALGEEHHLVREWHCGENLFPDLKAYLQLRVICAALNKGWQPKFTEDEWRYYPWFYLHTKTDLENMSEEDKKKLVIIDTGDYDTEYVGLVFVNSNIVPSCTCAYIDSHLCLKTRDLAMYCAKQFINLWADYLLRRKSE